MAEPGRRARIRVHPRFDRRSGLPSAKREKAELERVFGPTVPLSPQLRRELAQRWLAELNEDLASATSSEQIESLTESRDKATAELAEIEKEMAT